MTQKTHMLPKLVLTIILAIVVTFQAANLSFAANNGTEIRYAFSQCNPLDPTCNTGGNNNGNNQGVVGDGGLVGQGLGNIQDRFATGGRLTGSQTLGEFIMNIIDIILGIVLAIAILMLIIGGYMYLTSAGSEKQAEKGKKTVTYAVVGIIIIMLSYTFVFVINEWISTE